MVKIERTSRLRQRLALRLARDRSGVSAVEFALLLPVMLLLFFGAVEFGEALTIKRKVTSTTSSLADLVTQSKSITNSDMTNILNAAATIVAPYDAGKLKVRISGITIDKNGKATVAWSDAKNQAPLAKNAVVNLPAGVTINDSFLVASEVEYTYQPSIGYALTGDFKLSDVFYLRPRFVAEIDRKS